MNVQVHACNHELMEGVPHPCIVNIRWSHCERGVGTWIIDTHDDGGQMPHRHRHVACTISCLTLEHGSETESTSQNYQQEELKCHHG